MANDYRANAPKPSTGAASRGDGRGMNPMFLGIIIGLLLGIVLALGLAVWLNRSASPFQEKAKPIDALPTIAGKASPPTTANPDSATKDSTGKPRFEFYDILPGEKGGKGEKNEKVNKNDGSKVVQPTVKAADIATKPETKLAIKPADLGPAVVPTTDKENYLLQAGAFQNESEAENLKAQIAFAGAEAVVKSVNLPGKGTLYRVRLGPYKSLEEVNRIKTALSQNGINAAIVKPD